MSVEKLTSQLERLRVANYNAGNRLREMVRGGHMDNRGCLEALSATSKGLRENAGRELALRRTRLVVVGHGMMIDTMPAHTRREARQYTGTSVARTQGVRVRMVGTLGCLLQSTGQLGQQLAGPDGVTSMSYADFEAVAGPAKVNTVAEMKLHIHHVYKAVGDGGRLKRVMTGMSGKTTTLSNLMTLLKTHPQAPDLWEVMVWACAEVNPRRGSPSRGVKPTLALRYNRGPNGRLEKVGATPCMTTGAPALPEVFAEHLPPRNGKTPAETVYSQVWHDAERAGLGLKPRWDFFQRVYLQMRVDGHNPKYIRRHFGQELRNTNAKRRVRAAKAGRHTEVDVECWMDAMQARYGHLAQNYPGGSPNYLFPDHPAFNDLLSASGDGERYGEL